MTQVKVKVCYLDCNIKSWFGFFFPGWNGELGLSCIVLLFPESYYYVLRGLGRVTVVVRWASIEWLKLPSSQSSVEKVKKEPIK